MRHAWAGITCLIRPVQAVVQHNLVQVVLLQNCLLVPPGSRSVCPVPAPGFLNQKKSNVGPIAALTRSCLPTPPSSIALAHWHSPPLAVLAHVHFIANPMLGSVRRIRAVPREVQPYRAHPCVQVPPQVAIPLPVLLRCPTGRT